MTVLSAENELSHISGPDHMSYRERVIMDILQRGAVILVILISSISQASFAGPIRDRLMERKAALQDEENPEADEPADSVKSLPQGVKVLHDIPYGNDGKHRMDVYVPRDAGKGAPVIFMVHGGAWSRGDKSMRTVVQNKVSRWAPRGFIFISINYRLLPQTDPLQQAEDVARALATAQARAESWGGDPSKFILMGHSAGAHLAALLAAVPSKAFSAGVKPWLGTILLDSAALDVEKIMDKRHFRFYDSAFGKQPAYWRSASPLRVLSATTAPLLAVCSTRRADSCQQASDFTAKAVSLGARATVLEQDLSHREINESLGTSGAYTAAVEAFMGSLDTSVRKALLKPSTGTR